MNTYFQSFCVYLSKVENLKKNSLDAYSRDISLLMRFCEEQDINDWESITPGIIHDYVQMLQQNEKSNATINRHLASQRRFFRYLVQEGVITTAPEQHMERPKVERKQIEVLSKDQIEQLFLKIDRRSVAGLRDLIMLRLLYESGIKVSELIGLNVRDLNLKGRFLVATENDSTRTVYYSRETSKYFKKYFQLREEFDAVNEDMPLFINCYQTRLSRQGFWKTLKRTAVKADIEQSITPHTLRHSFAVHQLQNGVQLKTLQSMLGHSDIASTQVYENFLESRIV